MPWHPADVAPTAQASKPAAAEPQVRSGSQAKLSEASKPALSNSQTPNSHTPSGQTEATKVAAAAPQQTTLPATTTKPAEPPRKADFGLDIARIDAEGTSVIAGYAAPLSRITVMADGEPVGTADTDETGNWVLVTPHRFASADPRIEVRPGDHMPVKVASVRKASPPSSEPVQTSIAAKSTADAPSPAPTPVSTAAAVTRKMMQRLERLTNEAGAEQTAPGGPAKTAARVDGPSTSPQRDAGTDNGDHATQRAAAPAVSRGAQDANEAQSRSAAAPAPDTAALAAARPTVLNTGGATKPQAVAVDDGRPGQDDRGSLMGTSAATAPAKPDTRLASATSTHRPDTAANGRQESLPVPVQFIYRQDVFTEQGEKAAALLLKYFKIKQFRSVSLSGHADERGTPKANMRLSRQRLERIRRYLREGGFEGELILVPKGENEKFSGVDRSKFTIDDLYQLDRRVEVITVQ
jgi:outer membrane protein OmpA-like peptidoglycan-associated protein